MAQEVVAKDLTDFGGEALGESDVASATVTIYDEAWSAAVDGPFAMAFDSGVPGWKYDWQTADFAGGTLYRGWVDLVLTDGSTADAQVEIWVAARPFD
jgi:hypothetical protein